MHGIFGLILIRTYICALFVFAVLSDASASTHEGSGCRMNASDFDIVGDDCADAALSLMQRHAARFTSKNGAAAVQEDKQESSSDSVSVELGLSDSGSLADVVSTPVENETAIMNIIRHAEKCPGDGDGLSSFGRSRADYLATCMSSEMRSPAMPFGKVTALMAGEGHTSHRVDATVAPLAQKLGLEVFKCEKLDVHCFEHNARHMLSHRSVLVVAWAHLGIPLLLEALRASHHWEAHMPGFYKKWPHECSSATEAQEPSCVSGNGDSPCYDAIWQIQFTRPKGGNHSMWQAASITTLSQGFGGFSSSPCALDMDPKTAMRPPILELPKGWTE